MAQPDTSPSPFRTCGAPSLSHREREKAAKGEGDASDRSTLEAAWLHLTRHELPALATTRGWPVRADHCFQRILLDHAVGGRWYDHVAARPAYRHLDDARLAAAIALGRGVVAGTADLPALNRQSLAWRGK